MSPNILELTNKALSKFKLRIAQATKLRRKQAALIIRRELKLRKAKWSKIKESVMELLCCPIVTKSNKITRNLWINLSLWEFSPKLKSRTRTCSRSRSERQMLQLRAVSSWMVMMMHSGQPLTATQAKFTQIERGKTLIRSLVTPSPRLTWTRVAKFRTRRVSLLSIQSASRVEHKMIYRSESSNQCLNMTSLLLKWEVEWIVWI